MAIIEKDKPLPSHTRLNYDECYAKLILEKFFPDEYSNLELSDRPDLRDIVHNIGIEVTSAIPTGEQEAMELACKIPFLSEQQQKRRIEYLKRKGYEYTEFCMTGPTRSYSWTGFDLPPLEETFCADFFCAVSKKTDTLNKGHYAPMSRYNLFVQSELLVEDWMPPKMLEWVVSVSDREKVYSVIYLLALNGLFVFNIEGKTWTKIQTDSKLYGLGKLARNMVEEREKQCVN